MLSSLIVTEETVVPKLDTDQKGNKILKLHTLNSDGDILLTRRVQLR